MPSLSRACAKVKRPPRQPANSELGAGWGGVDGTQRPPSARLQGTDRQTRGTQGSPPAQISSKDQADGEDGGSVPMLDGIQGFAGAVRPRGLTWMGTGRGGC